MSKIFLVGALLFFGGPALDDFLRFLFFEVLPNSYSSVSSSKKSSTFTMSKLAYGSASLMSSMFCSSSSSLSFCVFDCELCSDSILTFFSISLLYSFSFPAANLRTVPDFLLRDLLFFALSEDWSIYDSGSQNLMGSCSVRMRYSYFEPSEEMTLLMGRLSSIFFTVHCVGLEGSRGMFASFMTPSGIHLNSSIFAGECARLERGSYVLAVILQPAHLTR
mmetsp:Transcript_7270/g.27223  ORF Transcript_7270/g.27223 Transcript_7270/m.27223 type:complete len:220 (+) Transcript_7270:294-953(+)